ncbi:MAG: aminotransferase class V-fold PLP-dependent enzyme [Bryobacterales bacterium]|nr:aminotransferase class V-fold PLP-dependent enzyme [Bryobacterales bacterium]
MVSRRQLFRYGSAATALAGSGALWTQRLLASPLQAAADESFWGSVRNEFPLEDGLIFLNAANVCPASKPVVEKHLEYLRDFYANPSFENRAKYEELEAEAGRKLARVLGAKPSEVTMTRNTSEATNTIVRGLNLRAGDEVVITSHNHPSNNASWKVLAKRTGVVIREVPTPLDNVSAQRLVRGIEGAITSRTKVIAFTHVTNTTGIRYPAKEITALAKGKNIWVHLDGAQSFGMLKFSLAEIGCDSYASSMHKWPMGPLEAGVLFVKDGRQDELWPSIVTAGYSELLEGVARFGVLGQRDDPRLVAAGEAAAFLERLGMANVEARALHLATNLKQRLTRIRGVKILTPAEEALSGAVVKFRVEGKNTQELGRALWSNHKISGAVTPRGDLEGIRWCPHIYNSQRELDRAADALHLLVG